MRALHHEWIKRDWVGSNFGERCERWQITCACKGVRGHTMQGFLLLPLSRSRLSLRLVSCLLFNLALRSETSHGLDETSWFSCLTKLHKDMAKTQGLPNLNFNELSHLVYIERIIHWCMVEFLWQVLNLLSHKWAQRLSEISLNGASDVSAAEWQCQTCWILS